jgi:hypothetical protein
MTTTMKREPSHWIIRVNDGENFKNSKFPFWGVRRGRGGSMKTIVGNFKPGDILWFNTSKKFGGKLIGMAEYVSYHDRDDEPLIKIDTITNIEQNWKGEDDWAIQINYTNLYCTEKQNIAACIQCASTIMKYETFKNKIEEDLYTLCKHFQRFSEPKKI